MHSSGQQMTKKDIKNRIRSTFGSGSHMPGQSSTVGIPGTGLNGFVTEDDALLYADNMNNSINGGGSNLKAIPRWMRPFIDAHHDVNTREGNGGSSATVKNVEIEFIKKSRDYVPKAVNTVLAMHSSHDPPLLVKQM